MAQAGLSVGPLITTQPKTQPVCPGASATLFVTASGATGYQWQSSADGANWQPMSGETASGLTVRPAARTSYRVVVSNAAASTTSEVATVTPPALDTEPSSGLHYGAVTSDGKVDAADEAALRAFLAGVQPLGVSATVADLDGSGAVDAVQLRRDDPSDRGGTCENWREDCDGGVGQCLQRNFERYPTEGYSEISANLGWPFNGRNSNTFVKCLARSCGLSAGPHVTGSAPGYTQPCPAGF